jgi:hypothetical protein
MILLPRNCEAALLERFLRAEAMAMWAVQAAQKQALPAFILNFLQRHEQDEQRHLRQFEELVGARSSKRERLPRVPEQWCALAVHLFGYEALGLEFATLLVAVRADLADILKDEEAHVGFFDRQLRSLLSSGGGPARCARNSAQAWWKRLPGTLDRYLGDPSFAPYRNELRSAMLTSLKQRFSALGLPL